MELIIGIIVLLFVVGFFSKPRRCDVCQLPLKRKCYNWKIDGKKQKLCPKCSQQMEGKISKAAFKKRFG